MDNSVPVRVVQGFGKLDTHAARPVEAHPFVILKNGEKGATGHIFHDKKRRTFVFGNIEHGHDAGVRKLAGCSCLAEESLAEFDRFRMFTRLYKNSLDRYIATKNGIPGLVDR